MGTKGHSELGASHIILYFSYSKLCIAWSVTSMVTASETGAQPRTPVGQFSLSHFLSGTHYNEQISLGNELCSSMQGPCWTPNHLRCFSKILLMKDVGMSCKTHPCFSPLLIKCMPCREHIVAPFGLRLAQLPSSSQFMARRFMQQPRNAASTAHLKF